MPPFDHISSAYAELGLMGAGGIIWLWGFTDDMKYSNWVQAFGIALVLIGLYMRYT